MSKDSPTLQDLFVPSRADRQMAELKDSLARHSKIVKWDAVEDVFEDKVLEMLDVPLLGVLLAAWKKYQEVKRVAGSQAPSQKEKVSLAQHSLKSEHHPYLEIRVKGVPVERLNFTILVELIIEGFILTIQAGKITAVQTGRMTGQGSLALETTVILEKEFGDVQLPETIELGEGIPLE